jgi:hypothetical protein
MSTTSTATSVAPTPDPTVVAALKAALKAGTITDFDSAWNYLNGTGLTNNQMAVDILAAGIPSSSTSGTSTTPGTTGTGSNNSGQLMEEASMGMQGLGTVGNLFKTTPPQSPELAAALKQYANALDARNNLIGTGGNFDYSTLQGIQGAPPPLSTIFPNSTPKVNLASPDGDSSPLPTNSPGGIPPSEQQLTDLNNPLQGTPLQGNSLQGAVSDTPLQNPVEQAFFPTSPHIASPTAVGTSDSIGNSAGANSMQGLSDGSPNLSIFPNSTPNVVLDPLGAANQNVETAANNLAEQKAFAEANAAAAKPGGLSGTLKNFMGGKFMGTVMMLFADYELFNQTEKETENATTMGGVGAAMAGAAALAATMHWLAKMFKGRFTMNPAVSHHEFIMTLIVAGAIVAAIVAAAVLAGTLGAPGPTNPTAAAVASALSGAPRWYAALSSASVGFLTAGLTLGGVAENLPSGNITQFSVPTVQLNAAVAATGSPNANILVQKATTTGGYDTVYVINPGAGPNGTSEVSAFQVDPNGYLVANGSPANPAIWKPFETPNANGNGYTINSGAFQALYQDPACTAIANDTSLTVNEREAALETCEHNNKNVQFIPVGG